MFSLRVYVFPSGLYYRRIVNQDEIKIASNKIEETLIKLEE